MSYGPNDATAGDVSAVLQAVTTSASIRFPAVLNASRSLAAVRVTDLTRKTAPVAEDTTGWPGTRVGTPLPLNCAVNLHFKILRRYRGGKPRIALPFLDESDTTNGRNWNTTPLNDASTAFTTHMQELKVTHGNITISSQVNVGYYWGQAIGLLDKTGREARAIAPNPAPPVDPVVQIVPNNIVGSSRRRLRAHTGAPA
jgi:hypothetical protein